MGSALFPLFRYFWNGDTEMAWRTVTVVPAVVAFITGIIIIRNSDDCPKGYYKELKRTGEMPQVSAAASFRSGSYNLNTWILYIQYACCFGVELTVNNAAVSYFVKRFGLQIETASAIASIFGFMNLFARGFGGYFSDKAMGTYKMRGRIGIQAICLILEGVCIFVFAQMDSLAGSIVMLTIFSIFVQAAEGSTYGIVPYVDAKATGAIAGIVGAGGPSGAVGFGLIFRAYPENAKFAFNVMAGVVVGSGILSLLFNLKGHRNILFGKDSEEKGTIVIPHHVLERDATESFTQIEDGKGKNNTEEEGSA